MSEIVILNKPQRLIIDPPSRTVSVVSAGNVTKEAMDLAIAAATWRTAWGKLAYVQILSNVGPFTSEATITGLTAAVTFVAGRTYRLTGVIRFSDSVTTDRLVMRIKEGATQLGVADIATLTTAASPNMLAQAILVNPTAGVHTFLMSLDRPSGTGVCNVIASANAPCFLLIEDIGPAT